MATPRLFKLKSQVAPAPSGDIAIDSPVARVWVDTGVYHLDTPLDYQVPEKLSAHIKTGVRVQVPFGTREVEGLVIERVQVSDSSAKLKSITKVLSPHAVATTRSLKLITSVAQHWATNPWEMHLLIRILLDHRCYLRILSEYQAEKLFSKLCQRIVIHTSKLPH